MLNQVSLSDSYKNPTAVRDRLQKYCEILFSGQIFQQTVGILMGKNCAPLPADLFLYGYEAEFLQGLLKAGMKNLAQKFKFTYRYIGDVLSLNNLKISEFIDLIYPCELEIKYTTDSNTSAS